MLTVDYSTFSDFSVCISWMACLPRLALFMLHGQLLVFLSVKFRLYSCVLVSVCVFLLSPLFMCSVTNMLLLVPYYKSRMEM